MHQMSYYHLILRYPKLRNIVNRCHIANRTDELFELLIALKMDVDIYA